MIKGSSPCTIAYCSGFGLLGAIGGSRTWPDWGIPQAAAGLHALRPGDGWCWSGAEKKGSGRFADVLCLAR